MTERQKFFNQAANEWDKKFGNPQLQIFLSEFVPSFGLKAGMKVLDVGTGTGVLIPHLHKAVGESGHITAVDYAENMVKICQIKHAHLPNVSVHVANVENLQFPAEAFDAITCFGLFPHLDNKKAALSQFHRMLKPKGKLIIAHALSSQEIKIHHQNAPPAVAHDVLPQETEMKQLLKLAGFTEIQIVDKQGCYLCLSIKSK